MPFLEHDGNTRELIKGAQLAVGSGSQAEWRLQNVDLAARHFTIRVEDDGRAIVRPQSAQHIVVVNGQQVGLDGTTLKHGDAIGAGSATIFYLEDIGRARPAVAASSGTKPYLVNEKERRAYPLTRKKVGIGRDAASNVLLRDPSVSRFHADIRAEAGQYVLYSMGSAGTKVNGHNLSAPQMLQEGDRVEVGDTSFVFTRTLPQGIAVADMSEDAAEEVVTRRSTVMANAVDMKDIPSERASASGSKLPIIIAVVVVVLVAVYFLFMR
jgi:predicted component of type VI protein secretion system